MKTALIVIDFINDIVHPDGKIPSCAQQVSEKKVIEKANHAIEWARQLEHLIVFVKVGFSSSYRDQPKLSPVFGGANKIGALSLDSWGTEFHSALSVEPHDLIVIKPRINPFHCSSLDAVLRANQINNLYVCGVSTTWAIQSVVRDAHDRDYTVHVISDACAADTEEAHTQSLSMLERIATMTPSRLL
ncbi:isochorismatase family cysteine hydrolase [Enterovibrio nigricans]|uniref:Nicotinamidase-related amidase n=1 Tax=Enterovibrio nigricans DSM 22720 TaxID=1121868 RepID=A0A1T4VDP3_9GAMM|nr:isochorismatase family cysteine hydrolase [Enterovibrio nigricans]PKF49905.1 cysteine hydrolase [Enterovibrio nigricans]SKA63084.1 Nicotinamidase-related amidase [Enterovibrio nigricans DSM 22720]